MFNSVLLCALCLRLYVMMLREERSFRLSFILSYVVEAYAVAY